MKKYRNLSKKSDIVFYEESPRAIIVEWADGGKYLYDYTRPGKSHVEQMKVLAKKGRDLNTYINQHVRKNYRTKLKAAYRSRED